MPSSGLMVFWFVLIVVCIPVCLWLLKRSGLASGAAPGAGALIRPVGQLNIGPGQRLLTVEVGEGEARTWLVLGVTSQQITPLHTMAPQASFDQIGSMRPGATAFAQLLSRLGPTSPTGQMGPVGKEGEAP